MTPKIGYTYRNRQHISDKLGGNPMSGISVSGQTDTINIFSNDGAIYNDEWDGKSLNYEGQGQYGDMSFKGANGKLRDHVVNRKRVFWFKQVQNGYQCIAELRLRKVYQSRGLDAKKKNRLTIRFVFDTVKTKPSFVPKIDPSSPTVLELSGTVQSRVGQGQYRLDLVKKWNSTCPITGCSIIDILIASHIKPYRLCEKEEKYDVNNGILLSPNIDSLFDKGFVSFTKNGRLVLSSRINKSVLKQLGIDPKSTLTVTKGMRPYLKFHRNTIFHK